MQDTMPSAIHWQSQPAATLPTELSPCTVCGVLWQANDDDFLLNVPNHMRFWVNRHQPIYYTPATNRLPEQTVRFYLQGLPLAAHYVQRGHFTLHAAAINTRQGAIIIAGHSASGKTTLAAAFAQRGYTLLADEVTPLIIPANGPLQAAPALTDLYLWQHALTELGIDPATCTQPRQELARYAHPAVPTVTAPQPITAIYLLSTYNQPTVTTEPITGHNRFLAIQNYAYNRMLAQSTALRQQQFIQLTRHLAQIRVERLHRPRDSWSIPALIMTIEESLTS